MLGLPSLSVLTLLLAPAALANNHNRLDRRHHVARDVKPVEELEARNEGNHTLAKRAFTGHGTFYYTGLGACGLYNGDNDLIVALNSAQYGGGYPGPQCFKWITIQSGGVTVGGVQITDECPTCAYGSLDMSPGLFTRFAAESVGQIDITWWFDDGNSNPPASSAAPAPTSTTPAWSPDPAPTSTSTWSPPPSSTSVWVAPSSTSTWVAPSSSSSTTSTVFSASSASSSGTSTSASRSANPYANVINDNSTSTSTSLDPSASASASVSSTVSGSSQINTDAGNLVAINGLVASYGQLIVVGAGGHSS